MKNSARGLARFPCTAEGATGPGQLGPGLPGPERGAGGVCKLGAPPSGRVPRWRGAGLYASGASGVSPRMKSAARWAWAAA